MISKVLILLIVIFVVGCDRKIDTQKITLDKKLDMISDSSIEAIKSIKVIFGHMSVGYNILHGMRTIISNDDRFREIEIFELSSDKKTVDATGLYHAKIGKNGFPKTKCDAFIKFLREKNTGKKFDIAFFKFCYADIERDYDIDKLFNYYVQTIDQANKEFPDLKIIHVTIPLTVHAWGLKGFAKNLLLGDIENVKRNQFNELLKKEYQCSDIIFDLAKIESTLPDGSRCIFHYKGKDYFSLYRGYTYDGGHLNDIGKFYAAKELLHLLAEVAMKKNLN